MSIRTMKEAIESVTGFDEIAVKQKFGSPLAELLQADRLQGTRALVFIQERHDGKRDDEAFHICQSMAIADLNARFVDDTPAADFVEPPRTTTP